MYTMSKRKRRYTDEGIDDQAGSPRPNGNDAVALREMEKVFTAEGIEVETVVVGNKDIRGCIDA